jgi:hypothetical protein
MKKIIVFLSLSWLITATNAVAQNWYPITLKSTYSTQDSNRLTNKKGIPILPKAGDRALGIDASPFLLYTTGIFGNTTPDAPKFNGTTFFHKMFIQDDVALRFGMYVNGSRRVAPTSTSAENTIIVSNAEVMLFVGREKRINLSKNTRLQGFAGVETVAGLGSAGYRRKYTYTEESSDWRPVLYEPGTKFTIGGNAFIGAEYFIAPGLAIGGQVGYGINLIFRGDSGFTEQRENEKRRIQTSGINEFNLGNFGGGITLMFYF